MVCFCMFYSGVLDHNRLPLVGILYLREIQEHLHGLENVTRVSSDMRVNWEWVKFQFWVKYPFKLNISCVYCHYYPSFHGPFLSVLFSSIAMCMPFTLHSTHFSTFLIFRNYLIPHCVSEFPPTLIFFFFLFLPPYVQKPHGGSASNLNMLGFPFVFLVQRPHNAASTGRDPLSADLIR